MQLFHFQRGRRGSSQSSQAKKCCSCRRNSLKQKIKLEKVQQTELDEMFDDGKKDDWGHL